MSVPPLCRSYVEPLAMRHVRHRFWPALREVRLALSRAGVPPRAAKGMRHSQVQAFASHGGGPGQLWRTEMSVRPAAQNERLSVRPAFRTQHGRELQGEDQHARAHPDRACAYRWKTA